MVLALAVAVAAIAAAPGTSSAASVCSNSFQSAPDFAALGSPAFFVVGSTVGFPVAWANKTGVTSPFAILTSSLPASTLANPFLRNPAGSFWLFCNLNTGFTPGAVAVTGSWVDDNGNPIPGTFPWVINGQPIPGVHQVARIG
jgi:hypothetical protein